jgi:hypothetical protein
VSTGKAGRRPPSRFPLPLIAATLALAVWCVPTWGGHEMPFYPSYYPQEITVETVAPAAAGARLVQHSLHAYVGADPWLGKPLPARTSAIESLGSFVVVTPEPTSPRLATAEARCAMAQRVVAGLADGGWTRHSYPVTPYHPDYLHHVDVVERARQRHPVAATPGPPTAVTVRARGELAGRLTKGRGSPKAWDFTVEEVSVRELVADGTATLHGGLAPPWIKQGWYQAWRLLAPAIADPGRRARVDELVLRLTFGGADDIVDRMNVERSLVGELMTGCERVIAGYTIRREVVDDDYSAGVENVAADSQTGLASAIFLRTVKLKDFPWNGWLTLGVPEPGSAAWNPVAGFTDPTGRLLWMALSDAALIPEPQGAGWMENRTRLQGPEVTLGPLPVPKGALRPEPGTGRLQPVGEGRTARARLTYRVLTSAFHDGTRMTVADAVYALAFAFRQGAEQDERVRRVTALLREALVGIKLVRVDTDVLRFGEVAMRYEVPVVDVYLARGSPEALPLATLAPPWSPVPWHVLALVEEAVRRGFGAFSAEEARRRGVPWLDLVRDDKLRDRLLALLGELEGRAYIPEPLASLVNAREARQRWAKLAQFAAERRHLLVTSGPYALHTWSPTSVVLRVFRDFSYPLGVGSFNRYPIPLRGFIQATTVATNRLEVRGEAQRVERFAREHRIVTEPVGSPATQRDRGATVVCRYVVLGADGRVVKAGSVEPGATGLFVVSREGLPPGPHVVILAIVVNGNVVNLDARTVRLG